MSDSRGSVCYTALTFAPVQGFIRSSRKLRDLYGSSLLLSHLAHAICADAASFLGRSDAVISPAGVQISQGVPNTVIIQGDYPKAQARAALLHAWTKVLNVCRSWLEKTIRVEDFQPVPDGWCDWEQGWGASWKAAASHSWEVFHGAGDTSSVIGVCPTGQGRAPLSPRRKPWCVPRWRG
jgi:CRISPR-associated protein Cmr2